MLIEPAHRHAGHRQRMKTEFLTRGLEGWPDHRVLELLLFYAIPQGDVNAIAHDLIDRFGSLAGVLLAKGLPPGLQGLDFALTALFTVLAVEQVRAKRDWVALLLGALAALLAGLWCPDYFLLAASTLLVLVLLAWPAKPEVTCDHV